MAERETQAMREQQQQFMERMDREHAALPPSTKHGFNQHYFPRKHP
jgi:hypothetical protein